MLFMRIILGVACASHVRATKREELVTDEAKRVNVTLQFLLLMLQLLAAKKTEQDNISSFVLL